MASCSSSSRLHSVGGGACSGLAVICIGSSKSWEILSHGWQENTCWYTMQRKRFQFKLYLEYLQSFVLRCVLLILGNEYTFNRQQFDCLSVLTCVNSTSCPSVSAFPRAHPGSCCRNGCKELPLVYNWDKIQRHWMKSSYSVILYIHSKVVFVLACVTVPRAFPLGLLRILSLISSSTVSSSAACSDLQRALEGTGGEGACRFGLEPAEEEGDVK